VAELERTLLDLPIDQCLSPAPEYVSVDPLPNGHEVETRNVHAPVVRNLDLVPVVALGQWETCAYGDEDRAPGAIAHRMLRTDIAGVA
jgi:hypothetical protein